MGERLPNTLFKVAFDAFFLQLSDGGQAVDGIAGKAADGLGDDEINFPGQRISHHGLEALAVLGAGAGDALIGIDLHEFPVVPRLYVLGVIVDLCPIAGGQDAHGGA